MQKLILVAPFADRESFQTLSTMARAAPEMYGTSVAPPVIYQKNQQCQYAALMLSGQMGSTCDVHRILSEDGAENVAGSLYATYKGAEVVIAVVMAEQALVIAEDFFPHLDQLPMLKPGTAFVLDLEGATCHIQKGDVLSLVDYDVERIRYKVRDLPTAESPFDFSGAPAGPYDIPPEF